MSAPSSLKEISKEEIANENFNKSVEPTENMIEIGLDSSCAGINLIKTNKVLHEQLMFTRARSLIEYAQLFISQLTQPEDPSNPVDHKTLCEKFEEYLNSLKGKQRTLLVNFKF